MDIEHKHCAAEGKESCIYKIEWEKRKKPRNYLWLLFLFSIVSIELFLFNNIFDIKDVIITVLGIISMFLTVKTF